MIFWIKLFSSFLSFESFEKLFLYFFVCGRYEFVWHVNVRRKKLRDSSKKIGIKRNDETTGFLNFLKAKNFFRHSCLNEYGKGERIRLIFFWQERQITAVWKRLNLNYIWMELKSFKIIFIKKVQLSFLAIKCFMSVGNA